MITLLHGDDIEASRAEFHRLKEAAKGGDVRTLDGRSLDPANLTQALESQSMFGDSTVVFVENLYGKLGRKLKLIETLAAIIRDSSADVVLWENKEMGVTVTKSLGKADIRLFKIPVVIFQLLDGLAPASAQSLIPLYQQAVGKDAPELIFAMITKRIRQLIQLSDGVISEGLQGWQLARLTRQSKLFTMDKLLIMYKKLLEMEYSIKSGSSPFTISERTEQFLIEL